MTLDEQLKAWRDATEGLTPTSERLAALQGVIDAPTPPGASGGGGVAAGTTTAVKVLLVTVAVGVIGWAVTQSAPWRWEGHSEGSRVVAADSGEAACPPMQESGMVGAPAMMVRGDWETQRRDDTNEYERQLKARPLTCEAQRFPLEQLMNLEHHNEKALARLRARHVLLCPVGLEQTWWFPAFRDRWLGQPGVRPECDSSDWCHAPQCDASTESCAQAYAARPAGSCNSRQGKLLLAAHDCRRLLRGELALDVARARLQRASAESRAEFGEVTAAGMTWCLNADALKEAETLRSTNAVKKESP